jgi:hypothetical protein
MTASLPVDTLDLTVYLDPVDQNLNNRVSGKETISELPVQLPQNLPAPNTSDLGDAVFAVKFTAALPASAPPHKIRLSLYERHKIMSYKFISAIADSTLANYSFSDRLSLIQIEK